MALPRLFIRVTHTGFYQNGDPNTHSVQIPDLFTGSEYQFRKDTVYVPAGGFVDLTASSRTLPSYENGAIRHLVTSGLVTAKMFLQPEAFTNATRPSPAVYPKGSSIWNDSDNALNYSDGAGNWRDASGIIT